MHQLSGYVWCLYNSSYCVLTGIRFECHVLMANLSIMAMQTMTIVLHT